VSGRVLLLVPLGEPAPDPPLLDWLGAALARAAGVSPVLAPPLPFPGRGPAGTEADRVLDALIDRFPPDGDPPRDWTLAVTSSALHAPAHGRVFGEATVGGGWAVVGLEPLMPRDPVLDEDVLRHRLLVEALHEIGHVGGLEHCPDPGCPMSPAARVEEVDGKRPRYCGACAEALGGLARPGPLP
jgi:archaemetzincin